MSHKPTPEVEFKPTKLRIREDPEAELREDTLAESGEKKTKWIYHRGQELRPSNLVWSKTHQSQHLDVFNLGTSGFVTRLAKDFYKVLDCRLSTWTGGERSSQALKMTKCC